MEEGSKTRRAAWKSIPCIGWATQETKQASKRGRGAVSGVESVGVSVWDTRKVAGGIARRGVL